MATIPGPQSFGGRPSLRTNRPVTQDNSAEIVAGGIADFGEASQRTGAAVQTRQDDFAIKVAQQDFYQLDDKVRREVQELDDYNKWDEEYKNRMAVGLDPIASSIRGSQNQTLFRESAETTIGQGSGIIFGEAFKREAQDGRAKTNEKLSALRESFLTETNPDIRTRNLESALGLIKAAEKNGYIDADDAQKARQDLSQNWALGWIEMRDTKEAVSILEASLNGGGAATSIPGIPHSDTVLKHSQDMIDTGLARENKDGTGSTFVGTVVNWEEINDGRASVIPSYINGKQYDYRKKEDRDEAMPYLLSKQWPSADTVEEAEQMEQTIHVEMAKQKSTKTGTPADLIPVDKRKAMLDNLKKASEEEDSLAEAYAINDSVSNPKLSINERLAAAKKASSPEARAKAESLIKEQYRVEGIASDELYTELLGAVDSGQLLQKGKVLKNSAWMDTLREDRRIQLFDAIDDKLAGKDVTTDWAMWSPLEIQIGRWLANGEKEKVAALNPLDYKLGPTEKGKLQAYVVQAQGGTPNEPIPADTTLLNKLGLIDTVDDLERQQLHKMAMARSAEMKASQGVEKLSDEDQFKILDSVQQEFSVENKNKRWAIMKLVDWIFGIENEDKYGDTVGVPRYQLRIDDIKKPDQERIRAQLGPMATDTDIVERWALEQATLLNKLTIMDVKPEYQAWVRQEYLKNGSVATERDIVELYQQQAALALRPQGAVSGP